MFVCLQRSNKKSSTCSETRSPPKASFELKKKKKTSRKPKFDKPNEDVPVADSNHPKLPCDSGQKTEKKLEQASNNKAGRLSLINKSAVTLNPNQNAQRDTFPSSLQKSVIHKYKKATCSTTLKESMYPTCMTLHSGASVTEATTVMQVCPYTYCSLNRNHHAQLQLLKQFLLTRRRLLRTQKTKRTENQSSVGTDDHGEVREDTDTDQMVFRGDHPISQEADQLALQSNRSEILSLYLSSTKRRRQQYLDSGIDEAERDFT